MDAMEHILRHSAGPGALPYAQQQSAASLSAGLRNTAVHILGGDGCHQFPGSTRSSNASQRHASGASTPIFQQYEYDPAPPTARQNGWLWQSDSNAALHAEVGAQNLPGIRTVKMKQHETRSGSSMPLVWSDGMMHMEKDTWPTTAVALFVFCGAEGPRVGYKKVVSFTLKEEHYVNYGLRLRCGAGDRYMGGSLGIVHSPDRREVVPGTEGQLVTVTNIIVNPDSTMTMRVVGDRPFRVLNSWMPRGLRGLQCAIVQVDPGQNSERTDQF